MQKKRKILWISVAWICGVLLVLGLTIHFAFKLKTVDVEFQLRLSQEETHLEDGIQEKVKTYFECRDNIILLKFNNQIEKAESENPYLKINSVIKVFPNTVRVYISERIPKFKVKDSEDSTVWIVLDEDFKVLDRVSETDTNFDILANYIEISNTNLSISLEKGKFASESNDCRDYINKIATGIYGVTEDYSVVKSIVYEKVDDEINFTLVIRNNANEDEVGCSIVIKGELNLTNKTFAGMRAYENSLSDGSLVNDSSSVITVFYDDDGKLVAIKN